MALYALQITRDSTSLRYVEAPSMIEALQAFKAADKLKPTGVTDPLSITVVTHSRVTRPDS